MSNLQKFVRDWLGVSVLLLAFFMLTRIWALLYYGKDIGEQASLAEFLRAFWMGFRFDLSAVAYLSTVPALAFLIWWSFPSPISAQLMSAVFRLWMGFFVPVYVFITAVDFLFYDYFQDHLNTMIFGFLEDDTKALIKTMWKGYNSGVYILLMLGLSGVWWWSLRKLFSGKNLIAPRWGFLKKFTLGLVLFLAVFLGARGTVALFPLNVADASVSRSPFVNYLAFSGVHAFVRAVKLQRAMETKWNINADFYGYHSFESINQDLFNLSPAQIPADPLEPIKQKTPKLRPGLKQPPHVVVIMMESFGLSWLKYHRDEFNVYAGLEKHFHQDYLFPNFLPSMTATIGSLSALMVNTPHRTLGEFLTEGRYFNVPFRTAPARLYREQGYKTRFLYGGAIGWRNVDRFARMQGFDSVEGDFEIANFEKNILNQPQETHDWGYYDDVVFKYLEHTLKEAKEPQFVLVMTTTNHPPFDVPTSYKGPSLVLPNDLLKVLIVDTTTAEKRFRAFQYSNLVLAEFLDRMKLSALAESTLVAVTGDHGFLIKNFDQSELLQKWQVPFYLYIPEKLSNQWRVSKEQLEVFGSHPDILPTLYELSLGETNHYSFGKNLLSAPDDNPAFHFSQIALNKQGGVIALGKENLTALNWGKAYEDLQPTSPAPQHLSLLKKYKATMAYLDFLFEYERKNQGAIDANPSR